MKPFDMGPFPLTMVPPPYRRRMKSGVNGSIWGSIEEKVLFHHPWFMQSRVPVYPPPSTPSLAHWRELTLQPRVWGRVRVSSRIGWERPTPFKRYLGAYYPKRSPYALTPPIVCNM